MLCVGVATFEYGILLAIRFGKKNKVSTGTKDFQKRVEDECYKIDRCALGVFMTVKLLSWATYTYVINSYS